MLNVQLKKRCITELGLALKQFGTYSFDDKGPGEVLDITGLVKSFKNLPAKDAGDTLLALYASPKYDGRPKSLVESLLVDMQDWDELFDVNEELAEYL